MSLKRPHTFSVADSFLVTFCTLVTSVILYQGLKASVTTIVTVVLAFLVICTGITILQMSKVDPRKLQKVGSPADVHHNPANPSPSIRLTNVLLYCSKSRGRNQPRRLRESWMLDHALPPSHRPDGAVAGL